MAAPALAAPVNRASTLVSTSIAPRRQRLVVACGAVQRQQETQPGQSRRSLLAGLALLAAAGAQPAQALPASRWDGESSAIGSCPLGDEGAECRQRILNKDRAGLASYEQMEQNAGKVGKSASGVPVSDLSTVYARDTVSLTDKVLLYADYNVDPANPDRLKLIKELKAEMPTWVSKYARGGSVRAVSARKVYVVVDAISAHFATNGLGPMPPNKLKKLVVEVQEGRDALNLGK